MFPYIAFVYAHYSLFFLYYKLATILPRSSHGLASYVTTSITQSLANLTRFANLTEAAQLIDYIVMCITYIFFYRACKAQGLDRNTLPYRGWVSHMPSNITLADTKYSHRYSFSGSTLRRLCRPCPHHPHPPHLRLPGLRAWLLVHCLLR